MINWYENKSLLVRCGLGTNQAEVGVHVMPLFGGHVMFEVDEGGEWSDS